MPKFLTPSSGSSDLPPRAVAGARRGSKSSVLRRASGETSPPSPLYLTNLETLNPYYLQNPSTDCGTASRYYLIPIASAKSLFQDDGNADVCPQEHTAAAAARFAAVMESQFDFGEEGNGWGATLDASDAVAAPDTEEEVVASDEMIMGAGVGSLSLPPSCFLPRIVTLCY